MNTVVIFDVSDYQQLVIGKMLALGYYKNWTSESKTIHLPSNVIWKPNNTSQKALDDIKLVVASIAASGNHCELLRCVVLNSTPWQAMIGKPTSH